MIKVKIDYVNDGLIPTKRQAITRTDGSKIHNAATGC